MGGGFENEYHPQPEMVKKYKILFEKYRRFGKFIESET
jgi:L-ribulokinase